MMNLSRIYVTGLYFLILLVSLKATGKSLINMSTDTISTVIADGAKPVLISKQFIFTEGPAVDKQGNVYFTDQPNDKIWKYDTSGKLSVFLEKTGRSNGLYFDNRGNLIACADEKNQLWSISPSGKMALLMDTYNGQRLNGPNDLWIDKKDGIYFTDPYYQRNYWERKSPEIDGQKVYYLPKGKSVPIIVEAELQMPNGIVGTPDGKFLYVADAKGAKTYKYAIQPDGTLTDKKLIISQGSDGMTLDNKGNIYLSGRGVAVYNPEGQKIAQIDIPAKWTGNVCFIGKERNILFITASENIYTLNMKVKGVE